MPYASTRNSASLTALLGASFLGLALGAQPASASEPTARLSIHIGAAKNPVGVVMLGLYDSPADFAADRPVQTLRAPAAAREATYSLAGLKPGRYAIKAFHDLNGDGRLNTNAFGLPTEPYAASGKRTSRLAPPSWATCVFDVKAGDNAQAIALDRTR